MPKVDMDMTSGTIASWHAAEGDAVEKGALLFEIETDKATMEVEAPASGTLHHVKAGAGEEVAIGKAVAWIFAAGEAVEPPGDAKPGDDARHKPGASANGAPDDVADDAGATVLRAAAGSTDNAHATAAGEREDGSDRVRATPLARRAAREGGLSLHGIEGTGPRGRIQHADVAGHLADDEDGPGVPPRSAVTAAESEGIDAEATAPPGPGGGPETVEAHAAPADATPREPLSLRRQGHAREGVPPVFLVHGFAADAGSWTPLIRALDGRETLALDLPGHGRSPHDVPRDFDALARRAVEAFDASEARNVHLVGHSLGGAVALAIADARPRAVAALTLVAPAGLGPEIDVEVVRGVARASRVESLTPWLRRMVGDPAALSHGFVAAAARDRGEEALRAAQTALAETLFPDGVQGFDLSERLSRIECPARILWGRSDRIIPWRHALAAPGRVALHLFPGLGHLPHVERPEAVAALLRAPAG